MKKCITLLLTLAMVLCCAVSASAAEPLTAEDITLDLLVQATTPGEVAANGTYAVITTYANTGDEALDARIDVNIYGMNEDYFEVNTAQLVGDAYEAYMYCTDNPEYPYVYANLGTGNLAYEGGAEYARSMAQSMYIDPEDSEIVDIEEEDGEFAVTVISEGYTYVVFLNPDGQATALVASYQMEGAEEPAVVTLVFDYSEDLSIDRSFTEDPHVVTEAKDASYEGIVDITTTDLYGEPVTNELIRDAKLVMVNLWEPWCGPCIGEMPDLQKLYEAYKDQGLVILGVYTTFVMDDKAEEIVEENGITYPILRANESLQTLEQQYVPATFFLDGNGEILTSEPFVGSASYEQWEARILEFLQ